LVSQELIDRTLSAALEHGAAAAALPIHLTIKQATGPLPAPIERTIPRQHLWAMQTPQVMRRRVLLAAFDRSAAVLDSVTDDVQLLELAGQNAYLVQGEERNLKITTALDLKIAEMILGGG
jgi:2-C-methyl-D-erythritol 4-phosphate cytidylyltransferase